MANCLHSHAKGIHPGAYVQPDAPDTTDVQDGTLWVDTSTDPPYTLKVWNATEDAGWQIVGGGDDSDPPDIFVAAGDVPVDGPPDPTKTALWVGPGEAEAYAWSPEFHRWLDVGFNTETLPNIGTPVLSDSSPPSTDPALPRLPTRPSTQIWIDQSISPPQINYSDDGGETWTAVGALPIVAGDAPGVIAYNDSGVWTAISADDTAGDVDTGTKVLTLDNDNPPKWGTFNGAAIITPADMPVRPPSPAVSDNCTQVRCGVSSQCANHLSSLNTNWAHWLGPLLSVVGTVAFAAVLANVIDPLFDVAAEGALAAYGATWATLRPYVLALTVSISGGFLPPLTPDMIEAIQQPLFCALTCEGGVVSPTPAQIATWRGAVAGLGVFIPGTLTQVLLDALLDFTPLQDWQVQAQQATPLSTCDEWTCS